MQPKFVRQTNPSDKAQELSRGYDKLIRVLFRIQGLNLSSKEKLDLLKEEYYKISDANVEKNELLISRLEKLKEEIKMSKPGLHLNFIEAMKLLRSASILDVMAYKQLIDEPIDMNGEVELKYVYKKENGKNEKKFLFNLIRKKINVEKRKEKDNAVNKIIDVLRKKIDFKELDSKLDNVDFEQVGSCVNGYSLHDSDYDISIITLEPVDERKMLDFFYVQAKLALNEFIGKKNFRLERKTHEKIRIPIVDISIPQGDLNISFTVNNHLGVYNSKLLKTYSKFDQRCQVLGLLVKIWANTHRVVSAKINYLSSYALILMVINFLQTMKNPILPSLQEISTQENSIAICRRVNNERIDEFITRVDFESDEKVLESLKPKYSTNKLTDLELLRKFFKFYSQESKFANVKLCVKTGRQVPRSVEEENTFLYSIEDPFDLKHNPGRSLKANFSQAEKFLRVMKKSYMLLKEGKYEEVFQPFI